MRKLLLSFGLVLATALVFPASAAADSVNPIDFTIYCTGGNTCSTSNSGLTNYWTFSGGVTETSSSTFDMSFSATSTGEPSADLLSWSITGFFGGSASVTNLSWTGPGIADPGKSNNGNDQCNSNVGGAVCFDLTGLSTTIGSTAYPGTAVPAAWDVKGSFTGTLGTSCNVGNGSCLVVLADGEFTSGANAGKTAFAISQDVNTGTTQVPEPSSMAFLAAGLTLFGSKAWRKFASRS